jgi:hypothetical protein
VDNIQKLKDEFRELCYELSDDDVVQMSTQQSDVYLHNVIVGIEKECFGFRLSHNPNKFEYQIFYVNGEGKLRGFLLQMTLDNPNRDNLVFMFSNHLTQEFPNLDSIDVFNTFQQQTRGVLEKENYFTMTSGQMESLDGQNPSILIKGKRFEIITLIDKVKALREYFGDRHVLDLREGNNYVYLMLNKRNGLVKIGTSIRPKFREKTLQGQEPEIFLLSIWAAPREIEKELHRMFNDKRKRGEWFKLKSRDMKLIKDKMDNLS